MFTTTRPLRSSLWFVLLISWFLTGCAVNRVSQNWPGLATDGETVYLANGMGVMAYDPVEQKQRWVYRPENRTLILNAPPSAQNGRVIFGDYGATGGMFSPTIVVTLYGLQETDSATPTLSWTNSQVATDKIIAAPLQVDDVVYVSSADFKLFALDAESGAELWRFTTKGPIWASPSYHEGILYVASQDKHVYALDAETGQQQWQMALNGAISSQPLINAEANLLYVGTYDSTLYALDLATGEPAWNIPTSNWVWSAPALANNTLYFADSNAQVYAADASTGEILWQTAVDSMRQVRGTLQETPVTVEGAIQASPVIANDKLYVVSEGNRDTQEGLLVALDPATGQEIWQQTTPAPLFATPIIVNDSIVVAMNGEETTLSAFALETGVPQWVYVPSLD